MNAGCTWRLEILRETPYIPVPSSMCTDRCSFPVHRSQLKSMAIRDELVSYMYALGVLLVFIDAVCLLLPPVIAGIVTCLNGLLVEPPGAAITASPYDAAATAAGRRSIALNWVVFAYRYRPTGIKTVTCMLCLKCRI